MKRTELLTGAAAGLFASSFPIRAQARTQIAHDMPLRGKPVKAPAHGAVQVAFVVGPDTVLIDVAGAWEALEDGMQSFHLYTVAPSYTGVDLGGIAVRPDHTFDNAPQPNVIVVPATRNLPQSIEWIKHASKRADITMSVCIGAFLVAKAGLFDGKSATTHHSAYNRFAHDFPNVNLVRGARFVEEHDVSSAGGETSGIDLGLRVVERYFGKGAALDSADTMEHVRTQRTWV